MRYFGDVAPVVNACRNLVKDQFTKFYGKFESELNSVMHYLYVYNPRLYEIGTECINEYGNEGFYSKNPIEMDVLDIRFAIEEMVLYDIGFYLGRLVMFDWFFGGKLDVWDSFSNDVLEAGKIRTKEEVQEKRQLYTDAKWLEDFNMWYTEIKNIGIVNCLDGYKEIEESKKKAMRLIIEHENNPLFNLAYDMADYSIKRGLISGKLCAANTFDQIEKLLLIHEGDLCKEIERLSGCR